MSAEEPNLPRIMVPPVAVPPVATPPITKEMPTLEDLEPELVPLKGIPLPPAVVAFAVITLLTFVFALTRLPGAVKAGVDEQKGKNYMAQGDGVKAAPLFEAVVSRYPNSLDAKIDLMEADVKTGQLADVTDMLQQLGEVKVDQEESARIDEIERQVKAASDALDSKIDQMEKAMKERNESEAYGILVSIADADATKEQEARTARIVKKLKAMAGQLDSKLDQMEKDLKKGKPIAAADIYVRTTAMDATDAQAARLIKISEQLKAIADKSNGELNP